MMEVPDDFSRDFKALADDESVLLVESNRLRLWCLMCAVQLASRHPEGRKTHPVKIAIEMAHRIEDLVATTPALKRIAKAGWDQSQDY